MKNSWIEKVNFIRQRELIPFASGLTHFTPPFKFEAQEKAVNFPQGEVRRNIILVGRFFEGMQSKRQVEAIEAFNRISNIRKET